jgi:glycine/D-amino acid oxidase-like deaminating enzyme
MAVLKEFSQSVVCTAHAAELIKREDLQLYLEALRSDLLIGVLWSPKTWKVDQREACSKLAAWLQQEYKVSIYFSVEVKHLSPPQIEASAGIFAATYTILCCGSDFVSLFS